MTRFFVAAAAVAALIASPALAQTAKNTTAPSKVEVTKTSKSTTGAKKKYHKKAVKKADGSTATEMSSSSTPAKK